MGCKAFETPLTHFLSCFSGFGNSNWCIRSVVTLERLLLMESTSKDSYGKSGSKTHALAASIVIRSLSPAVLMLYEPGQKYFHVR